ncbi:Lrp/AsnC ligand binding domain-containing protein [Halovivax gelatinilyticus]|uniref:Lrp/AsnC ligand binding domain-containing protein n=1 Tax=Halovivax gelatinilyticus TaxID=2961597 RepID=UPI0020CA81EA|nr:Lrp/AsnC ligand binding domain-containing protein [Halovivax gelatinilyticus]
MVHAFIMVKTSAGTSEELLASITEVESVEGAHIVAGEFDIIAEVDAPEVYDVLEAVSTGVQTRDGVIETKTYIALD